MDLPSEADTARLLTIVWSDFDPDISTKVEDIATKFDNVESQKFYDAVVHGLWPYAEAALQNTMDMMGWFKNSPKATTFQCRKGPLRGTLQLYLSDSPLALFSPQETPACLQMHICTTSLPSRLTQRRFPDRSAVGCLVPMVSDTLAEVSIIPSPTYNGYHPGYLPASRFNEGGGNGASRDLLLETSAKCCFRNCTHLRLTLLPDLRKTSANLRQDLRAQPPLRHRADAVGNSYIIRQL
ncbi:hypothetical protein R3P38DRAFT_2801847 [Favolaschia claudopus]|uniref:Uncharacterized protein n=1 Tax=Favolaschia claudopus TaxID=2862362 RepID=A0AAV9ZWF7_9AGAR